MKIIAILTTSIVAALSLACGSNGADPNGELATNAPTATAQSDETIGLDGARRHAPADILLVHGAWADGSSWANVTEILQRDGFTVHAVQLREQSLADDVSLVQYAIKAIPNRLVVAGHSYGGAVISGASAGQANVSSLVYIAAFAPDEGESLGSLEAPYPTPPLNAQLVIDSQGNATIDQSGFLSFFAPDVPRPRAMVLFAVQHPLAANIFGATAGPAGWRTLPNYYAVSTYDQAISPDLERFLAARMNAKTIEIPSSHVSLISHPVPVAGLIEQAATEH